MGGAANYVHNLVAAFTSDSLRSEIATELVLALPGSLAAELPDSADLEVIPVETTTLRSRAGFEQVTLRRQIRDRRIDVLFASANLAMVGCPVPQLLLVRNAIFFSPLYERRFLPELQAKTRLGLSVRRRLVALSVRVADRVMTPSQSMLDLITDRIPSVSKRGIVNHYGVDATRFQGRGDRTAPSGTKRLLFTGLYSAHKNLKTVLEAIGQLSHEGIACHFTTTADPSWSANPNTLSRRQDIRLASELAAKGKLTVTGMITRSEIDKLYSNADIFVYPSTVESFGHPLVEAMASRLPIVAADVPINREICGEAALYFAPFSPEDCASAIKRVSRSQQIRCQLSRSGQGRLSRFSNEKHFLRLAHALQSLSGA